MHLQVRFGRPKVSGAESSVSVPCLTRSADVFQHVINENSHEIIKPYGQADPPDPALLYQLPDEVRYGSTLFGFQRTY